MKRKILILVLAAAIPIIFTACGGNEAAQQNSAATQVASYEIKPVKAVYYDEYPATVNALNQVELRPLVSGYITGIYFQDGQAITKGMKLYAIDEQQYKAAYEQAVANLNVARANLEKAQQDADRYTDLEKHDAIAKQVVQHAQADLQSAKMQVIAAQNNVDGVQTNLRNSIIYAPFEGTIGISQVKLGSAVTTGQTLLNTVSSNNPIAVDFFIDEKQIGRYDKLLQQKSDSKDSIFTIVLADQSIYPYTGRISLIDRAVDQLTGTIRARIIFENPAHQLKPGMTCDLRIKNLVPNSNVLIPAKAIVEQMGEYFVFVINGNHVSQKRIEVGRNVGDMTIIKNGLALGDQIVTEGLQRLHENSLVAVNNSNSQPHQNKTNKE